MAPTMKPRPFISYAHEDSETAAHLYDDLRALGAEPWLDKKDLLAGQDWQEAIRRAIRESTHFIALVSAHSVNKRGFVQKELRQALATLEEFPPGEIFVIPVRLDETQPRHDALTRIHWVNLFPSYEQGLSELARSMSLVESQADTRGRLRRGKALGVLIVSGLLLAALINSKVASSERKAAAETQQTTTSSQSQKTVADPGHDERPLSGSLRASEARLSERGTASGDTAFPSKLPNVSAHESVMSAASEPITIHKRNDSQLNAPPQRDPVFHLPSHLEPELVDSYWARELESSILGHGRITPELRKRQLEAVDATTRGDWHEAQQLWESAATQSSCCGDYLNYNLAVARANDGDWAGAIEPLKKACGFGDLDRSGYALGVVYAHLQRWRDAAEILRSVDSYSRYAPPSRQLLAYVEGKLKAEWDASS